MQNVYLFVLLKKKVYCKVKEMNELTHQLKKNM